MKAPKDREGSATDECMMALFEIFERDEEHVLDPSLMFHITR